MMAVQQSKHGLSCLYVRWQSFCQRTHFGVFSEFFTLYSAGGFFMFRLFAMKTGTGFALLVLAAILLPSVALASGIFNIEIDYWGETVLTGPNASKASLGLPVDFPSTWSPSPDFWDFVYGVRLVEAQTGESMVHFNVGNPYYVPYIYTLTPNGWFPPSGFSGAAGTIDWLEWQFDGIDNSLRLGEPAKYFAFKVAALPGTIPGTVQSESHSSLNNTNPDLTIGANPEPQTWLLLVVGLIGLAVILRKSKSHPA
jgi:hypothetical protein